MQVKVFESPDMASGLKMVRKELGSDALILSTRTVRNGKLGLLGKSIIEITAAVDDSLLTQKDRQKTISSARQNRPFTHQTYLQNKDSLPNDVSAPVTTTEDVTNIRYRSSPSRNDLSRTKKEGPDNSEDSVIKTELDSLKSMINSLAGEISRMKEPRPSPETLSLQNNSQVFDIPSQPNDQLSTLLLDNDISAETVHTISGFAQESLSIQDMANTETLVSFLQSTISGLLSVAPIGFDGSLSAQKRIALVGPTGVGKTTTLAKIAAKMISEHGLSIAFITIDTYRIAAVEQLKVYGEIMGIPVDVVISPSQLAETLQKHEDKDLVLIDTAGRSPRDAISLEELAEFLKPELNIEKNLVLSAVARETELLDTISQFNSLGIDKTIFTKIDECSKLGVLLNIQIKNPAPLSCITNGQRVPEDLLDIDSDTVSKLIIPPLEGSVI